MKLNRKKQIEMKHKKRPETNLKHVSVPTDAFQNHETRFVRTESHFRSIPYVFQCFTTFQRVVRVHIRRFLQLRYKPPDKTQDGKTSAAV